MEYGTANEGCVSMCSGSVGRFVVGEETETVCDTESRCSMGRVSYTRYTLMVYGTESACVVKVEGSFAMVEARLYYSPSDELVSDDMHDMNSKTNLLSCMVEDVVVSCVGTVDGMTDRAAIDYVLYVSYEKEREPETVLPGAAGSEMSSLSTSMNSAVVGKTMR